MCMVWTVFHDIHAWMQHMEGDITTLNSISDIKSPPLILYLHVQSQIMLRFIKIIGWFTVPTPSPPTDTPHPTPTHPHPERQTYKCLTYI